MHLDPEEQAIRELSDDSFKDHQITELSRNGVFRSWRCGRPSSGTYRFFITTYPGVIVVTGDIGDLIVERVYDMLPWCRDAVDSTEYFAQKVPHAIPTKEFSLDVLRAWIAEMLVDEECNLLAGGRELLQEADEDAQSGEYGEEHFYRELADIFDGADPPSWQAWNSNFLWCRDAIRWFVMNHSEPEITG